MMRRTRVPHVIQDLNSGGMERVLADIARCADHETMVRAYRAL